MSRMPALYIPHGGGPSFFMTGERKQMFQPTEDFLRAIEQHLPATPRAILCVTAHWESPEATFAGGEQPDLIYDYYGFPPETYQLQYPAPGQPALAQQAAQLLQQAGFSARVDPQYGWDHGVFIPLKVMYPQANIPVVAMSLHERLDPVMHSQWGRALSSLRDQGVLILGSGMSYHNLRDFSGQAAASFVFHDWLDQALSGDWHSRTDQLSRWHLAPGGVASHPRAEHLLPLMVASGAGSDQPGRAIWRGPIGPTCAGAWAFD
jgi:aromatic ring-opening dioxygenase catalytic subunit (LigB family)